MPALLITMSTLPNALITPSKVFWMSSAFATSQTKVATRPPFAGGGDRLLGLLQYLGPARQDRHIGAGCGELLRHGKAEPHARAGDDGAAAVKTDFHSVSPLDGVGAELCDAGGENARGVLEGNKQVRVHTENTELSTEGR